MRILGIKPGHDGSIALVEDGRLAFSLEGEKDSHPRYTQATATLFAEAAAMSSDPPDVVSIGGWHKWLPGYKSRLGSGYLGLNGVEIGEGEFFGSRIRTFSSSHERSHVVMAATMAPEAPIRECTVLVWEGIVGALYQWRDYGRNIIRRQVLSEPGTRYAALFALADPSFADEEPEPRLEDAGKLMALSAYGTSGTSLEERKTVEAILQADTMYPLNKASYKDSPLYNCGLMSPVLHRSARFLTDELFELFYSAASHWAPRNLPLVISGGCGLNCEWNRKWVESGLFSTVFVPPCANDSGSAIGTAMDAAIQIGEPARLEWSVYSGAPFRQDCVPPTELWSVRPLDNPALARCLAGGDVVAWVQGRCEIGPRALGHRSLLASPSTAVNRDLLNEIKGREEYRPIAPCCRYEELDEWFDGAVEDPYMLYFAKVKGGDLPAVTHVDGTARVQSVRHEQEPALHSLLTRFREETGHGVLCNTSLNFPGHGFINSMSELLGYCETKGLRQIIVDSQWYQRR